MAPKTAPAPKPAAAPPKAAPPKAAPTKAAPTKAAPTKAAPTKAAPTKAAPTKAAPPKPTAAGATRTATGGGESSTAKPSGSQVTGAAASQSQATASSSSRTPASSTPQNPGTPVCDKRPRKVEVASKGVPSLGGNDMSLVKIEVYISQGKPQDYCSKRHVKAHFTSPQVPGMQETVHAVRYGPTAPWEVLRDHHRKDSEMIKSTRFLMKMDPVWVWTKRGQEMVPVDIFASVKVAGHELETDWSCHHFLLEGFEKLYKSGYKTKEWYEDFMDEFLDRAEQGALDW